jgi:Flp pilus assembly protein TadG
MMPTIARAITTEVLRIFRDRKGGVAPLLALSAIPLFGAAGAGLDYSRANFARTAMQSAADAAVIMLAKETQQNSGGQPGQNASAYFNANFARPDVQNVQVTAAASSTAGGTSLNLSARGSIPTMFVGLMGFSTLDISVSSGAFASADGLGCVLSLDLSAGGATTAQGSTSVNLTGCSLYDNSKSSTALTVGGSAAVSALSVGVVGGLSGNAGITAVQGIRTGIGPVVDPYADDAFPNFFGCTDQNFKAKSTVTINPGVYCGGMSINAGANVTLNPGIYYLDGGSLSVNGGAAISGSGVTLVFTKRNGGNWATATINGNATVNLTPPKSGPTAGIVMFGDRNIPIGTTFKFNGGAAQYLGGAIYLPTAAISFAGGAATNTSCTQIIGNTITFVGNSSLAINCSSYETKPFSPLAIKLTS